MSQTSPAQSGIASIANTTQKLNSKRAFIVHFNKRLEKRQPFINPHTKIIKIKIQPEVSYINGFKGENGDIPIVRTRRVKTIVYVKDQHTVLIGGLFNSSDSDTENKAPFLGNLPLIGNLFSSSKKSADQTELVIAITPKIIDYEFQEIEPHLLPGGVTKNASAILSK